MSRRQPPSTRIFMARFSDRTRERDLYDVFDRYGRVRDVALKNGYAFIEFDHIRDAEDAVYDLDGRTIDGSRVIVEFARPRGGRFGDSGDRRGMDTIKCYSCGEVGHKSAECPHGSEPLCFGCRQPGHIRANCPNEGGGGGGGERRGRSRSRSRSPGRGRDRSRSPSPRRQRSVSPRPSTHNDGDDRDDHNNDSGDKDAAPAPEAGEGAAGDGGDGGDDAPTATDDKADGGDE